MDRLYYTYLIIKESLDYIPAVEIKKLLEENYQIKVDIKTVYQAIRNINELSKYIYQKEIIKGFFVSAVGSWALCSIIRGAYRHINDVNFGGGFSRI